MCLREQVQGLAGSGRIALAAFDAGDDVELPGELRAPLGDLLLEEHQAPLQSGLVPRLVQRLVRRQLAQDIDRPAVAATSRRGRCFLRARRGMIRHYRMRTHGMAPLSDRGAQ